MPDTVYVDINNIRSEMQSAFSKDNRISSRMSHDDMFKKFEELNDFKFVYDNLTKNKIHGIAFRDHEALTIFLLKWTATQ